MGNFFFHREKIFFSNKFIFLNEMPSQIYTILYISECRERTSTGFLVVNATGYTRLENNSDKFQKLNITAFYPTDDSKPCYLPKLVEGQVLSVSNSKFAKGVNGELDVS